MKTVKWLTHQDEILNATDEELKKSLLTSDGMGSKFKEQCPEEFIRRKLKQ